MNRYPYGDNGKSSEELCKLKLWSLTKNEKRTKSRTCTQTNKCQWKKDGKEMVIGQDKVRDSPLWVTSRTEPEGVVFIFNRRKQLGSL